ncbi:MAG: hypothetical protein OXH50_17445, partial [Gemmatimonadetes bacterium]|nr:hypothetical protein [Gemmatimonadota bacterium]
MPGVKDHLVFKREDAFANRLALPFVRGAASRSPEGSGKQGIPHKCEMVVNDGHPSRCVPACGGHCELEITNRHCLPIFEFPFDLGAQIPEHRGIRTTDEGGSTRRLTNLGQRPRMVSVAMSEKHGDNAEILRLYGFQYFFRLESRAYDRALSAFSAAYHLTVHQE